MTKHTKRRPRMNYHKSKLELSKKAVGDHHTTSKPRRLQVLDSRYIFSSIPIIFQTSYLPSHHINPIPSNPNSKKINASKECVILNLHLHCNSVLSYPPISSPSQSQVHIIPYPSYPSQKSSEAEEAALNSVLDGNSGGSSHGDAALGDGDGLLVLCEGGAGEEGNGESDDGGGLHFRGGGVRMMGEK